MTRVALCGAGFIATAHAAAARANGYELIAVSSRSPERAAAQARALRTRAATYDELPLGAHIVVVATPPPCHLPDARRMLDAGVTVLVEKPLCTTLAGADTLVDAGGPLLYAENLAHAPVVQQLLARVAELGTITHLEARAIRPLPTWGRFTTDAWGGGALFDLGVHPLALTLMVAAASGLGRPAAVAGELRGGAGHGTDEHAELRLSYSSGLTARVVSSWQGASGSEWDVQVASATGVLRVELRPEVRLERDGEEIAMPAARTVPAVIDELGYAAQLRDAASGRAPLLSAAFGREVLDVVCAAYWSAGRDGEATRLPFAGPRTMTPLELWRAGVRRREP